MKTLRLIALLFVASILCFLFAGCSFRRGSQARAINQAATTTTKLNEEVKSLVTGVVDALSLAPTNAHVSLALELSQHAQQIVGTPLLRLDISGMLSKSDDAIANLKSHYNIQGSLLAQQAKDAAARGDQVDDRLVTHRDAASVARALFRT